MKVRAALCLAATVSACVSGGQPSGSPQVQIPEALPTGVSGAAWHQVEDSALTISGRVFRTDSMTAVDHVLLLVKREGETDSSALRQQVGTSGQFRLPVDRPGAYRLRFARIGYDRADVTVVVTERRSVRVVALMSPAPMTLQGSNF